MRSLTTFQVAVVATAATRGSVQMGRDHTSRRELTDREFHSVGPTFCFRGRPAHNWSHKDAAYDKGKIRQEAYFAKIGVPGPPPLCLQRPARRLKMIKEKAQAKVEEGTEQLKVSPVFLKKHPEGEPSSVWSVTPAVARARRTNVKHAEAGFSKHAW